jgi:hypothetical protein
LLFRFSAERWLDDALVFSTAHGPRRASWPSPPICIRAEQPRLHYR